MHFAGHLLLALLPEADFVGLFEPDGGGFLQRAHAAVTYACVRRGYGGDEVLLANQPADAPACGVEVLARRADGERELGKLGG